MSLLKKIGKLGEQRCALGFIRGGMDEVMNSDHLEYDWVKMPKDRWYADPFILDVTDNEILLLVEDYPYATRKGVISLLHINRNTMEITTRKELLELPTHLSFPAIWRKDGHIYVYPESANSGRLDMYEYHPAEEELTFVQTICNDVVWDSYITEALGKPLLFTSSKGDYYLDIYKLDTASNRFVSDVVIPSERPNSRLGGAVFEYKGELYYPAQDCRKNYGGAIDIKRIKYENGKYELSTVKHLTSPHPIYPVGMHTLNEYKGVVVIDVLGYRYGKIGIIIARVIKFKKKLKHARAGQKY